MSLDELIEFTTEVGIPLMGAESREQLLSRIMEAAAYAKTVH